MYHFIQITWQSTVILAGLVMIIFIGHSLYMRYFPIWGLHQIKRDGWEKHRCTVVDLRDYHVSNQSLVEGAINIPISYFQRQSEFIPKGKVFIVVSTVLEKNLGVRQLRKKGIHR
ncbi:hypothetical protein LC087_18505 [Bacillus carboniphilus]|uniref:Uncharacterized protein n=1 Tax=Bacillus carboniphilus TaxID=86663 RepID=A0ABY9JTH2_9BACI|nr:hypothetical protein [Bacillus carboniphilus]WLR42642.1 hypothetical protein LC087_18505 [Bacillus carboniphilus]